MTYVILKGESKPGRLESGMITSKYNVMSPCFTKRLFVLNAYTPQPP